MRFKRTATILCATILIAGCAYFAESPRGKAYQAAGVLVAANTQVQAECIRSKLQGRVNAQTAATAEEAKRLRLQGIYPFTKKACAALKLAYDAASLAAEQALDITSDPSKQTPANLTAAGVAYVYTVASMLGRNGIIPAPAIQKFVDAVDRELLKTREVK